MTLTVQPWQEWISFVNPVFFDWGREGEGERGREREGERGGGKRGRKLFAINYHSCILL